MSRKYSGEPGWYIAWSTGSCAGSNLHLRESLIEMVCAAPTVTTYVDLDGETITIAGVSYRLTKI